MLIWEDCPLIWVNSTMMLGDCLLILEQRPILWGRMADDVAIQPIEVGRLLIDVGEPLADVREPPIDAGRITR